MKLSIIIVSYNTKELLQKCLDSLVSSYSHEFNTKLYEIIVVDNNSIDDSAAFIQSKFPQVILIQNKTNQGFSKANNAGVKKSKGTYVLFLNPDTEVNKNTLLYMLDFMEKNPNVGVLTCQVLLPDGKLDDASHRGFPTPWRALCHFSGLGKLFPHSLLFDGYHLGYKNMNVAHEIDACAGAFLLIRRDAGEKVRWFDEDYFWYGEDLDLCFKVKKEGWKIMYVPDVSILHHKGAASGFKKRTAHLAKIDEETKKKITQARFNVMRIFYKKHYQRVYPQWVTTIVLWGIIVKQKLTESGG